ncbi:hypothetical protein L2E82_34815 [Cichorium intybus]|uniref:Uncharacterized protein n=1 Tax=Cichorium intybus TaxID=13427 RepID=A0ACB9BN37_CICIN|nr:hypothetical protein L2E82_34815 [Cichorium intybus]
MHSWTTTFEDLLAFVPDAKCFLHKLVSFMLQLCWSILPFQNPIKDIVYAIWVLQVPPLAPSTTTISAIVLMIPKHTDSTTILDRAYEKVCGFASYHVLTVGSLHQVDSTGLHGAAIAWHDEFAPLPKPLILKQKGDNKGFVFSTIICILVSPPPLASPTVFFTLTPTQKILADFLFGSIISPIQYPI